MGSLKDRFDRAGGVKTIRQYAENHLLLFALTEAAMQGLSQKSLEIVRLGVSNKVQGKLRRKYRPFIREYLRREAEKEQSLRAPKPAGTEAGEEPDASGGRIWVLWMTGMDEAPEVVKMCFRSLQDNLPGREIVLLSEKNYRDYVSFPAHIEEKYKKGVISKTHLSDLIRLSLLIRYGGTWVDATVFCTGGDIPAYMLDSELFLFQDLKPGLDGHAQRISNWFITARPGNPILKLTRAMLYEYWRTHDKLVDYYVFHDLFEIAIETYPGEWERVIPFSNAPPHILLLRLFEPCDEKVFDAVRAMTPFHKLTYKFEEDKMELQGTYYQALRKLLRSDEEN